MLRIVLLSLLIKKCSGVIYNLNASSYELMPPLFALDEYEVCLSQDQGLYCVLRLELFAEPENELMRTIREYSAANIKHYNHSLIDRGICVRKSCESFINSSTPTEAVSEEVLAVCVNDSLWRQYGLQARVSKTFYCDTYKEQTEIETLDWMVAALFLVILLLNVAGTVYDYVVDWGREKDILQGNELFLSFSVRRNWNWLVSVDSKDGRTSRLKGLHGVRILANICTISAHTMMISGTGFSETPHDVERTFDSPFYQIFYNGMMIVQIFFVLSGFLLVYNMKLLAEKTNITWWMAPKLIFMRWWRLTPALACMIAFTTSWMRHVGSGPMWKFYIVTSVADDCRKYWWYHLLYINNYQPLDLNCALHTWHVAVDTQLFLVGLLLYLASRARARGLALAALLALGVAFPAVHIWMWDMDAVALITPEFYRTLDSDAFHYLHVYGHNNIACFAIGMAAAELVYKMQQQQVDISKHKILNFLIYLTIPAVILLMYCGHVFYSDGARSALALRVAYGAAHRLVLGLLVAFLLVVLLLGGNSVFRELCEWRGWVVPSRLTYSMYLLHLNLINAYSGVKTALVPVSTYYLLTRFVAFVVLGNLISVPFYLTVEAPFNRAMKAVMDRGWAKPRETPGTMADLKNDDKEPDVVSIRL